MDLFDEKETIGIVGSRRRNSVSDYIKVAGVFYKIYRPGDRVVSGGCKKGADRFAELIVQSLRRFAPDDLIIHLPDKSRLPKLLEKLPPRIAHATINYDRNTLIARDATVLIACVAFDRKGGTEDTIAKFKRFHKTGQLFEI